ncbi:MAG: HNH endonuclease [Byssovorax sp.]
MSVNPATPHIVMLLQEAYAARSRSSIVARQGKGRSAAEWVLGDRRFFDLKKASGTRVDYRTGLHINLEHGEVRILTVHCRTMATIFRDNLLRQPHRLLEAAISTTHFRKSNQLAWSSTAAANHNRVTGTKATVVETLYGNDKDFEESLRKRHLSIPQDLFPSVPNTGINVGPAPSAGTYFALYVADTDAFEAASGAEARLAAAELISACWPLLECFYPDAARVQTTSPGDSQPDPHRNSGSAIEGTLVEESVRRRHRDRGLQELTLERDDYRCQQCGFSVGSAATVARSVALDVHHVNPLCDTGETKTRLDDLITLCANCHRLIHAIASKHAIKSGLTVGLFRRHAKIDLGATDQQGNVTEKQQATSELRR